MNSWKMLYDDFLSKHKYIKLNEAATKEQIINVENALNCILPDDLQELLLEINGDGWFLLSTEQIIETNLEMRQLGCFMPLDHLVFFAGNGNGDFYGYPITQQDGAKGDSIFFWDHEYDNRIWIANSLKDIIIKYYLDEC